MQKEKNEKLLEKYKHMTYKELETIECNPNISYNNYVIVALAQALKEHEETPNSGKNAEEVFQELLGEEFYKINNKKQSTSRFI